MNIVIKQKPPEILTIENKNSNALDHEIWTTGV